MEEFDCRGVIARIDSETVRPCRLTCQCRPATSGPMTSAPVTIHSVSCATDWDAANN
jgi:hypothetical protein